jgi:hypothetical protein
VRPVVGAVCACIAAVGPASAARAATITVVDALPGQAVQLRVDGRPLGDRLQPGASPPVLRVRAGHHVLRLDGAPNVHLTLRAQIARGDRATLVAHLTAHQRPRLSLFRDRARRPGAGRAVLAVRHTAAVPVLDVLLDGRRLFRGVLPGGQRLAPVRRGAHRLDLRVGQVRVSLGRLRLDRGGMTVVYVLGGPDLESVVDLVQRVALPGGSGGGADPGELWKQFPLREPPPRQGGGR